LPEKKKSPRQSAGVKQGGPDEGSDVE